MADLTVPVRGDGVALLYAAVILLVLTWIIFMMRLGVRLWRKALGTDDYYMLVGIVRVHFITVSGGVARLTNHHRFSSLLQLPCVSLAVSMALDNSPRMCRRSPRREGLKYVHETLKDQEMAWN
jgi:hypothetical protein